MKWLLLLTLFLVGCDKYQDPRRTSTPYIKVECTGTKSLGDICKYTTRNGHSTCVSNVGYESSVSVTCDFYDIIVEEIKK